jgi:3-isopropylmalate dehydrogenase
MNPLLSDCILTSRPQQEPYLIGVLPGEGIGPEVVEAALSLLPALPVRFELVYGGAIGRAAEKLGGEALSGEVCDFCASIFARRGAILAGPGGGRFVYDLRRRFDLYCKLSPLRVSSALLNAGRMRPEHVRGVDFVVVRDNAGGLYQGEWRTVETADRGRRAHHDACYDEADVRRILEVGARVARQRRGEMVVIYKESGLPSFSDLWRDCAAEIASAAGVRHRMLDVDYAAYWMLQHAGQVDVLVTPNLLGDIISDLGGVLVGSRGLTFSGNYAANGAAVYQTNHGAAYDLAGTDRANPAGQIYALAMLLRESFGLRREADAIEAALERVWHEGCRTEDVAEPGLPLLGTRAMAEKVSAALAASELLATSS